jgi:hypothetical protein
VIYRRTMAIEARTAQTVDVLARSSNHGRRLAGAGDIAEATIGARALSVTWLSNGDIRNACFRAEIVAEATRRTGDGSIVRRSYLDIVILYAMLTESRRWMTREIEARAKRSPLARNRKAQHGTALADLRASRAHLVRVAGKPIAARVGIPLEVAEGPFRARWEAAADVLLFATNEFVVAVLPRMTPIDRATLFEGAFGWAALPRPGVIGRADVLGSADQPRDAVVERRAGALVGGLWDASLDFTGSVATQPEGTFVSVSALCVER